MLNAALDDLGVRLEKLKLRNNFTKKLLMAKLLPGFHCPDLAVKGWKH